MSGETVPSRLRVVGIKLSNETLVPVVILKAAGEQAEHVVSRANTEEVPIVRASELTSKLYRIPIDQAVTPDLFPLMAALLAHVIHVDKQRQLEERVA